MGWFEPAITRALHIALKLRRQIRDLPEHDVRDIETKSRLLSEAEEAMQLLKLGADLLIASALATPRRRDVLTDSIHARYTILVGSFEDAGREPFTPAHMEKLRQDFKAMREEVDKLLNGRTPFHWPLEFPEVFAIGVEEERGFSAIVSNPPFSGGSMITGTLGTDYREYLVQHLAHQKKGIADLCAYFFLRVSQIIHEGGRCGLLATKTIAQGDTREVGLDQMEEAGWTITRAITSRKWPGTAAVQVALLWLQKGKWKGKYILDDKPVIGINSSLNESESSRGNEFSLIANSALSFTGSKLDATGFILQPEEAHMLVLRNPRNNDVLFPFLNADDVNSQPDQSPTRWVINFRAWPLELAETYPDCMSIVREKVKPQREKQNDKGGKELWWQYLRPRPALYSALTKLKRTLVIPIHSKYMICVWKETNLVFSHALCIIALEDEAYFALLQSTFHDAWARETSSSLGETLRYTPSKCFDTFPFPRNLQVLTEISELYNSHRQSIMLSGQEGLTQTYNRFHDPDETAVDIVRLRKLHKEMDEAVALAYGWDDLELEHGFHETKQGLRYTISEEARREVLGRLLKLNHERYAEEEALGLHEKGAKKGKAKKGKNGSVSMNGQGNGIGSGKHIAERAAQQERLF
jgi:hypothetical protein